jgi:hypothetical protein
MHSNKKKLKIVHTRWRMITNNNTHNRNVHLITIQYNLYTKPTRSNQHQSKIEELHINFRND